MKLFSFFLPQFYETKENNQWWGEGFTEWTNVKQAIPLYKGHIQPLHPQQENYYNMLDKKTMQWQTSIMKTYGLYGMVYYHYYFNGRLLLEKPAENLLKWKEINQPFFFCWANHTWYRSWEGTKKILIEQTYGNRDDWKAHFDYLLPFFKDDRYEKVDNKPLFMIYDTHSSPEVINEMFKWFDRWCKEEGFNGMKCIRECFHFSDIENSKTNPDDWLYFTEPQCAKSAYENRNILSHYINRIRYRLAAKNLLRKPIRINGNNVYKFMIKKGAELSDKDIIPGVFFAWDNTPRHKKRGYIINCVDKNVFTKYMNIISKHNYAIVNAWNEWAEGMMLEPTEENGYRNLEWIKEWMNSKEEE